MTAEFLSHIPAKIDRYCVEGVLGEGGTATVYRVRHAHLHTVHALKLLRPGMAALEQRLLQEGRMQGRLRHRNVVAVTDVIEVEDGIALVMDFVHGASLAKLLRDHTFTGPQIDHLAQGLFDGLEAAHQLGLVHRDLKPANVLLAIEGDEVVPKLLDFGFAKAPEGSLRLVDQTRPGSTMGTPQYMAPEQILDASSVGHTADIYGLGLLLYEACAGHAALPKLSDVELLSIMANKEMKKLRADSRVREDWIRAIEACLEPDPANRPQSLDEVRHLWTPQAITLGSSHLGDGGGLLATTLRSASDGEAYPAEPRRAASEESTVVSPAVLLPTAGPQIHLGTALLVAVGAGIVGAIVVNMTLVAFLVLR